MTEKWGPEHVIFPFRYFYQSYFMVFSKTKHLNLVSGTQTFRDSLNGGSHNSPWLPLGSPVFINGILYLRVGPKNDLFHISNTRNFNVTPQIHKKLNTYRSQQNNGHTPISPVSLS